MKYTVLWTPAAEQSLAQLWVDAPDRAAVAAAANRLDTALAGQADSLGESRNAHVRIAFDPLLGIEFEVLDADRMVYVLAAWCCRPLRHD